MKLIAGAALLGFGANSSLAAPPLPAPVAALIEALPGGPEPGELNVVEPGWPFVTTTTARSLGGTLVIPKETVDAKSFTQLEEDLNVMARVLNKAAGGRKENGRHAMGIAIHNPGYGAVPSNLYIEGYGALFFVNVNFPLLAPAAKKADAEPKDETSSEWEEARREIYRAPESSGFEFKLPLPSPFGGQTEAYDADKVEELKGDLVAALKNAAHIRKLKSDETVTVVVTGRGATTQSKTVKRTAAGVRSTVAIASRTSTDGAGNKMILRVRKSDVEALQKAKINAEEFQKQVAVMVY